MSTDNPDFTKHIDIHGIAALPLEIHFEIINGDMLRVIVDNHNTKTTTSLAIPLNEILAAIPMNVLTAHVLSRRVQ